MFKQLPEKLSYPEIERSVLDFWESNDIFNKTMASREGGPSYSFFEGPPTVNGKPGIHHMMARTIKDAVCRYKTLRGYYVRRQAGWDTHGLPVEIAVEKQLGLKDKSEIEVYGIDKFNAKCREFVYKNIEMDEGWRTLTRRMGYWVDMDKAYITCTNDYVESVWWALKSFFDKGLIYKGFKVVPQSPTIATPLSSHELSLGYRDVKDPNCYIKLKVTDSPRKSLLGAQLLVWTTTPWTLVSNVALAAGREIDYVLVRNVRKQKEETMTDLLVLAKSRLSALEGEYEIMDEFKGEDFLGTSYEQIIPIVDLKKDKYKQALTVLPGDFVSTEDGSGIVHLAPAFGEDDYQMSLKFDIPFVQPVTPDGHFTPDAGKYAGRAVKTLQYEDRQEEGADKDIIIDLKIADKIYRTSNDYVHSYPHCWRTGNPIIYYARESWFIKSPAYKETMVSLNKTINWQPPEIGEGRFGNWLEDVKDWSLSRDRYWGTPLPIWVNEANAEDIFAIGSIDELKRGLYEFEDGTRKPVSECGVEVDLHRPFVDNVVFVRDGKTYRRTREVIDVWFDSGSMPFAQFHYPFENKELFEQQFPGDFIAEGIDQTRGWFYTLHNIASALFGKPAFKNIVVNELILDDKGIKMSKSKGNVIDPFEAMDQYGADAVRWYLFVNNPPWKATLFSKKDLEKTVISDFFRSLTNTYAFFALYANIDKFDGTEAEIPYSERPEIDRWALSRINTVVEEYKSLMDAYELTKAHRLVQSFTINELSNWYIRRNRRRFWKGEKDNEKIAAYQTLRTILLRIVEMMASLAPFLSEELYQRLRSAGAPESVHLTILPESDPALIDLDLERRMQLAQQIVSLARSLRERSKIRVRQPLRRILVPALTPARRRDVQSVAGIIQEELNIKEIEFISEDSDIIRKKAIPNFKVIGKKFGKSTQVVATTIKGLNSTEISSLERDGSLSLSISGENYEITREDVDIASDDIEGWLVASEGDVTVALDTTLDEELICEGLAREFINRVQNMRKDSGFEVTDRINIDYIASVKVSHAIEKTRSYIASETLAESIAMAAQKDTMDRVELDDEEVFIKVTKL
ncbi:MAG: isoleucine--tRNA ligase [Chloroflexota bacterium]